MKKISVKVIQKDSTVLDSKKITDPFVEQMGIDKIIIPKYDPELLNRFVGESNVLPQCIEAYKRQLLKGWSLRKACGVKESDLESPQAEEEKKRLESVFSYSGKNNLMPNLKKVIEDRERAGTGYLEVIRNPAGDISGFMHIPQATVRYLKPEEVLYTREINTPYGTKKLTQNRIFNRFVQLGFANKKVYFKEFGDPRQINWKTGEAGKLFYEQQATEILPFKIQAPDTVYGVPRYMGNLLSILGSRRAELVNYYYFENGKHVPLAILVEGGSLTQAAMDNIKDYLEQSKGVENSHKIIVLEAEPDTGDAILQDDKKQSVRVKFENLTSILQQDALFVEYDKENRRKIRLSFQLPPILIGETDDYTRATAKESATVAEKYLFRPLRSAIEDSINLILQDMGVAYWEFGLEKTDVKDREEISKSLTPFLSQMTPNQIQKVLSVLMPELETTQFEDDWGNLPLFMQQALPVIEKDDKAAQMKDTLTEVLRGLRKHENHTHG